MELLLPLDPVVTARLWLHLAICVALWLFVFCAIGLDLWDGVRTASKSGERVHSHKLRITIEKMSEYWRFMLIAFIVDAVIFIICSMLDTRPLPAVSFLFCIGLIGIEIKSMYEHAKRRKSHVMELTDILGIIVKASTDKDARKVLDDLRVYLESERDKKK
mgnify:FL=1